jgi:predicted DNA binding CopG/RHH family protein
LTNKKIEIEDLGTEELTPELDQKITAMIELADQQVQDIRVGFRWGTYQLSVVKRAAEIIGVPYQTFMKMTVFQRAVNVLKDEQITKPVYRD